MSLMLALWTESSFTDCVLEKDFLSNMSEHLRSYRPTTRQVTAPRSGTCINLGTVLFKALF